MTDNPFREAIARIVDPASWKYADHSTGKYARIYARERIAPSLTKADAIIALFGERPDIDAREAEIRQLVRQLDVAMHGEEGAAEQASLCDLIGPAERTRAQLQACREALERLGSMEAFVVSRAIDPRRDEELLARIDFARAALSPAQVGEK